MDDEPEMRSRFQYKMSLKMRATAGRCMPRVDEYYHAEFGAIEFGRNEGIRRGEPEGPLVDGDARGDLSLGGGHCTVTRILFRLILYWNQLPISGSFYDWKMLSSGCATRKWRPARFIDKRLESKRRCTQEVRRFVGSLEKPRPIDHPFIYDLW